MAWTVRAWVDAWCWDRLSTASAEGIIGRLALGTRPTYPVVLYYTYGILKLHKSKRWGTKSSCLLYKEQETEDCAAHKVQKTSYSQQHKHTRKSQNRISSAKWQILFSQVSLIIQPPIHLHQWRAHHYAHRRRLIPSDIQVGSRGLYLFLGMANSHFVAEKYVSYPLVQSDASL